MNSMNRSLALSAVLFGWGVQASAAEPGGLTGYLDVFSVPSADLEVRVPDFGSADDDGDGHGVRALVRPARNVAVTAELQATSYDSGLDHDQFRVGVGYADASSADGGVYLEYLQLAFDDAKADGLALHLRVGDRPTQALLIQGDVGYMRLEDESESFGAWELAASTAYEFAPGFAAFIEYRDTALRARESRADIELADVRIGARLTFGRRP